MIRSKCMNSSKRIEMLKLKAKGQISYIISYNYKSESTRTIITRSEDETNSFS